MTAIRFGTDGWRAVMNRDFVVANVRRVAWAIGQYVLEKSGRGAELVIAHDTRFFAEEFAEECARVCVAQGLGVRMAGRPLPTPLAAFSVGLYGAAGAIMLTASHNPAAYNGMKFIPSYGGPATPEITGAIEEALARAPQDIPVHATAFVPGECEPYEAYKRHVAGIVDTDAIASAAPKVIVDAMFGAGQGTLASLLTEFGCDVRELHAGRDVLFGGRLPDPSAEGLAEASRAVREEGRVLGLGLDGDADRFGVVDETGAYFGANELISLLAMHLGRDRGKAGAIVRTVATTHRLDDIARVLGRDLVETPVGFKWVAEAMLEREVMIGGEESGGLSVGGHIPEKDGLLANMLAVELHCYKKKTFTALMAELDAEVGPRSFRRLDLEVPEARKAAIVSALEEEPPDEVGAWQVESVSTMDGVRLQLEGDRWLLVRPSGTEPLLRVYLEAGSESDLAELSRFAETRLA
jgi:phosphomannomutase